MATRGAKVSPDHVEALNMIDIEFYGRRSGRRSRAEKSVVDAWKIYLDWLSKPSPTNQDELCLCTSHRARYQRQGSLKLSLSNQQEELGDRLKQEAEPDQGQTLERSEPVLGRDSADPGRAPCHRSADERAEEQPGEVPASNDARIAIGHQKDADDLEQQTEQLERRCEPGQRSCP